MNKYLILVLVIVIGVVGFFGYQNISSSKELNTEPTSSVVNQPPSQSTKRILFFFANWCPTCKAADESLAQNASKIPDNIVIIKINYNDSETDDAERELAKKYGITYQHTFVQIDENGNEIMKWNGGGYEELISNIK
jgi:thiol-disulfide isomerase/thioredoxin